MLAAALLALGAGLSLSSVGPSPGTLVENLQIGLILGSVYALIALGYTLVYGVIKLINFAHGDVYMVGAFLGYYLLRFTIRWLHFAEGISLYWSFAISVVVSALLCAVLAVTIERLAYRPLRKSSRIAVLITAVGVSFLLENLGIIVFGANPKSYEPKTLGVYQVQVATDEQFSGATLHEVQDATQLNLPNEEFFARVRTVSRKGVSEWGPVARYRAGERGALIERPAEQVHADAPEPQPPPSLGFSLHELKGRQVVSLSWPQGRSQDIALDPVFSDSAGRSLAFTLPLATASGEGVRVPVFNMVIVGTTAILLFLLNLLINRTMFGISMRALSYDLNAAKLMGVNTDFVISGTFAIGGACAAVAGNMVGMYNQTIEPLMGILPGLKAFIAAVIGGIGSIPGAAVGGLIMGLSESFVKGFIPQQFSALSDAFAFAILIIVLLFKPSGIFGRSVKEKV